MTKNGLALVLGIVVLHAQPLQAQGDSPSVSVPAFIDIQEGDTLWDLCAQHLGGGWHWPQIWSYNPEITNPHWIYPGDRVRFVPSLLPLPVLHAPAQPIAEKAPEAIKPAPQKIDVKPIMPGYRVRLTTQVLDTDVIRLGTLMNANTERLLLRPGEQVFFKRSKTLPEIGKTYALYREAGKVKHPKHRQKLLRVEITGTVLIEAIDKKKIHGKVLDAFREIERGNYMADLSWEERRVEERVASGLGNSGTGKIFALPAGDAGWASQPQIVYVDAGKDAGLQAGVSLRLLRKPDHRMGPSDFLTEELIGRGVAVDVKDDRAAVLIVESQDGIRVGDGWRF